MPNEMQESSFPWLTPEEEEREMEIGTWLLDTGWQRRKGESCYTKVLGGYVLFLYHNFKPHKDKKTRWNGSCSKLGVEVFMEDEKDPPSPSKIVSKLEKACIAKIAERIGMLELEKQRLMKSAEEIDSALQNGV